MSSIVLIDERELEVRYAIRRKTAQRWRLEGKGPRYLKLQGVMVRYRVADVEEWLGEQEIHGGAAR